MISSPSNSNRSRDKRSRSCSLFTSQVLVLLVQVTTLLISFGNLHYLNSVHSFIIPGSFHQHKQTTQHHCKLSSSFYTSPLSSVSSQCVSSSSSYNRKPSKSSVYKKRSRLFVTQQEIESTENTDNSSEKKSNEKMMKEPQITSIAAETSKSNSISEKTKEVPDVTATTAATSNTSSATTMNVSGAETTTEDQDKSNDKTSSSNSANISTSITNSNKTLYEILNSNPDATRSELKRNYIALVRQTHPDAQINGIETSTTTNAADENPEFQEIMIAWRTLSNPFERKRYDRQLRAKEFASKVEKVVGDIGKTAGPQFLNAFENVAIPFLRRTTATTLAGFTSISKDIANYGTNNTASGEESGLGGIIANAVKSGQKAGRAIDCLELMEKSRELSKRADAEAAKAREMKDQLSSAMNKRINLTLHTPNAKLTSLEACMILDGMNTPDTLKMTDMLRLRRTVAYEIEQLQNYENDVQSNKDLNRNLQRDLERKSLALEQAKANSKAAEQAEIRARKALEDAKSLVASTNNDIQQSTAGLAATAEKLKLNELELEKKSASMIKQQEKVRVALRRKEEALHEAEEIVRGDFKDESLKESQETIEALLKEERYLRAESARMEAMAARLSSRSRKLERNSNEIEHDEEVAWEALEEATRVAEAAAKSGYGKYGKFD